METETPVPVKAMLPEYVPAAVNNAVLPAHRQGGRPRLAHAQAGVAESTIHDWFALAVSATAEADTVLT
jgi:hypothetical protein